MTAAGLAAAVTAAGLAGTARLEAHGIVIPALHDAASDRATPYTPVCSHTAVPVCLQPAYRAFLPDVTAALGPVLGQLAGLPGAPVRITQVAVTSVRPDGGNFGADSSDISFPQVREGLQAGAFDGVELFAFLLELAFGEIGGNVGPAGPTYGDARKGLGHEEAIPMNASSRRARVRDGMRRYGRR